MFTLTLGAVAGCALAAFVAAFIDSIAGGGGLITLPALLLAGVPPHLALGTNKTQSTVGTAVSVAMFARGRFILWRLVLLGVPFALLGSSLGSLLALRLDGALLGRVLVLLLPFAMALTLFSGRAGREEERGSPSGLYWLLMPLVSLAIGCYDGFFGPGTGSFLILALHWILGVGLVASSATAKVLNLTSNLGALAVFLWNGQIVWGLALPMVAASMAGNWLGSRTAMRVGRRAVRFFLTLSLGLLLATLIWRHFLSPAA